MSTAQRVAMLGVRGLGVRGRGWGGLGVVVGLFRGLCVGMGRMFTV